MSSSILRMLMGAVVGGVVGLLMYRFVGCRTGACPLTANPYVAAIIWGALGAMMAAGSPAGFARTTEGKDANMTDHGIVELTEANFT